MSGSRIALRRMAALIDSDPEVRAARINAADVKAIREGKRFAIELVEAACARFATRTCLGERATGRTITFGALWSRVAAAAAVVQAKRGELIGVAGPGSIDWVIADLACLYLGAVSVPIPTALTGDERTELLARLGVTRVIEHVAGDAPAIAPATPAELFSVVFTSGSTGGHKGVMLPERRWAATLRDALQPTPMPAITIGYLPLSHMAGRIALYTTLIAGGTIWFAASPDMSSLFDDLRAVRPTTLTLVPRISNLIYQRFQTEVAKGVDAETAMAALRAELGSRLCFVATGAAPTAPDVLAFLETCFEVHVVDTYGSTELGRVTVNGRVDPGIAYKLVDVPELGYTTRDHPYPRGELAVKSERESPGYFGDGEATARLRDAEGYVLSGDIVEERAPGHLVWIDRKHGVLRLANGESVNPSRLEELFAASPAIDQIFLHGSALRSYVLAVIVPAGDADRRAIRGEIDRIAAINGLRPHEVPRDFIVEAQPFTVEAGLVAETGKLRRARLAEAYRAQLDALVAEIEARQLRALDANAPIADRLRGAIAIVLGLDAADVGDDASFARLGGDSLSALRLAALIAEHCGVALPVATLLDPAATVGVLAARTAEPSAMTRLHGASRWATPKDLAVDRLLPAELIERAGALPSAEVPQRILLTGAAGFVGRFVLLELARDREVTCIVRAPDDATARARVRETFAQIGLGAQFDAARISVYAGDLARPGFGLASYAELAERIDAIVHAGALVNHALAYEHLCEPNVLGTAEIARFAITARRKPIHFVSTSGLAAGMRRRVRETESAASLWPRRPLDRTDYAAGYITSKWAAETLLADLHARCGVPVTIARCGMVLPHPTLPAINAGDAFCRLVYGIVRTRLAPESFYAGEPQHYDALPVDVVAALLGGLARRAAPGLAIVHVTNPHRISLDEIVDWLGVPVEKLPHAAWYPRFRAALEALPADEQKRSPLPIVERWAQPLTGALELDGEHFAAALGHEVPALTQAYIAHCAQLIQFDVGGRLP